MSGTLVRGTFQVPMRAVEVAGPIAAVEVPVGNDQIAFGVALRGGALNEGDGVLRPPRAPRQRLGFIE